MNTGGCSQKSISFLLIFAFPNKYLYISQIEAKIKCKSILLPTHSRFDLKAKFYPKSKFGLKKFTFFPRNIGLKHHKTQRQFSSNWEEWKVFHFSENHFPFLSKNKPSKARWKRRRRKSWYLTSDKQKNRVKSLMIYKMYN